MFIEMMGIDLAVSAAYALLAVFVLFFGLRWLDKRNGRPWNETIGKIREDSLASSIYYSARWLGACLVVASFIAR